MASMQMPTAAPTSINATTAVASVSARPKPNGYSSVGSRGAICNPLITISGEITADGHPVALDPLATKLTELKQAGGDVWYHRENPEVELHANAMKVVDLVVQNKLPIRLSSKPDFSEVVDEKGVVRSNGQ